MNVKLSGAQGACPTQWFGTLEDGSSVIIHYRFGLLRVYVSEKLIYSVVCGSPLDGSMSTAEMQRRLEHMFIFNGLKKGDTIL